LTRIAFKYYDAYGTYGSLLEGKEMRTTIELTNDHRSSLHSLAARRGLRGYSKLIQEAVDLYIQEMMAKEGNARLLLKMRGTWNKEDSRKFQKKLREIRKSWKIA
jgi:metal-responsive CopG/Arc/MetJ family transcriptional regulator